MLFLRDGVAPTTDDFQRFHALVSEVLAVRSHPALLTWLQGALQEYLPHDVLLAAWGDFHLGVVYYDLISGRPDVHTENASAKSVGILLKTLFDEWVERGKEPYSLNVGHEGVAWEHVLEPATIASIMEQMSSSLVHGISDHRGRHDCLYIFFSQYPKRRRSDYAAIRILLPYIDAALRQVELRSGHIKGAASPVVTDQSTDDGLLSPREMEIMHWVSLGKTNSEIGDILDVSAFTVKNHMQRIFKKMDVINRAQAVSKYKQINHQNT